MCLIHLKGNNKIPQQFLLLFMFACFSTIMCQLSNGKVSK